MVNLTKLKNQPIKGEDQLSRLGSIEPNIWKLNLEQ